MAGNVAPKRRMPPSGLQRRVRARKEAEPESDIEEGPGTSDDISASEAGPSEDDEERDQGAGEDSEGEGQKSRPKAKSTNPSKVDFANVSFGALAKAQASMPSAKRRKGHGAETSSSEEDSDIEDGTHQKDDRRYSKKRSQVKRSSKHAPTEMTAKRPVSRRREFDTVAKLPPRDPRFDAAVNSAPGFDESHARKAYAFLDGYRASEMAGLRAQIKKTRDPAAKEQLQRELLSMESKKKATDRKDHERRIIEEHRQKEKELVKQGKQPFYLKKAEQKKRLLTEQFQGMKKRQVDKSIERRRKKVAGREKKELDYMQRRQ